MKFLQDSFNLDMKSLEQKHTVTPKGNESNYFQFTKLLE